MKIFPKLPVLKLFLLVLLFFHGQVAFARDYAVEMIVFERIDRIAKDEEMWDFSPERVAEKLQNLQELASTAVDYETEDSLSNLEIVRQNLVTAGYRILHAAKWTQPAEVYQNAPLISFGTENTSLPFGFIRVYRTSLIFADIDVQLSPISPEAIPGMMPESIPETGVASDTSDSSITAYTSFEFQQPHFYISEKRRLKFEEIHYFDHPRFGVIIGVWPEDTDL